MKIKEKTGIRYCRKNLLELMAEAVPTGGQVALGNRGFTLIELLLVTLILAILVTLAIPSFRNIQDTARISRAAEEIRGIEKVIRAYQADRGVLPANLNEIGQDTVKDPWGNPYEYHTLVESGYTPYFGHLEDLNTVDFDLFSKGADGVSDKDLTIDGGTGQLQHANCADDVIRAGDGSWVGHADRF